MKVTVDLYGQFLLSSQLNYTCTYLAEHFSGLTHDNVQDFLKTSRFTSRMIWQRVKHEMVLSSQGYLIFDDTVLRIGNGAENHHTLRKLALQILQQSSDKHSIKERRKKAGWNNEYLLQILAASLSKCI